MWSFEKTKALYKQLKSNTVITLDICHIYPMNLLITFSIFGCIYKNFLYFCGVNFKYCNKIMLAEFKRILINGVNAEKSSKVVWEVSTIEYTGGKRNADSVLFDTFCSSNNFYNKIVSCFKSANNVEVLKNKCKEENNEVVFKNVVYKVLNSEKYKTFGVCLKRKNIWK